MLILDLRWLLFALLVLLVAVPIVVPWLYRCQRRRASARHYLPEAGELAPALEQAPFGLLLVEGACACRYANAYARRLLGLKSPGCLLPEAAWADLLNADRAAVRQAGAAPVRYRGVALAAQPEEAKQFVRWWITPQDEVDVVFLLDVTGQQRAEEAARSLLNDVSHELRTPLATILTHLEVLSLPGISPELSRQSIHLLRAESKRMARLVHLMLELGRLETGAEVERRPLDLLALVEEAVAQVASQAAEHGIALSLEAESPLPPCLGDGDRLRQVFLNLLDNAVKYCRPGDIVVVSLAREGENIRCAVCDDGPGIPAQHLPHVTRRFYRAAPQEVEGSGLGLTLAEEILRRHGSNLAIESHAEGEQTGTRVSFLLPEAFTVGNGTVRTTAEYAENAER